MIFGKTLFETIYTSGEDSLAGARDKDIVNYIKIYHLLFKDI